MQQALIPALPAQQGLHANRHAFRDAANNRRRTTAFDLSRNQRLFSYFFLQNKTCFPGFFCAQHLKAPSHGNLCKAPICRQQQCSDSPTWWVTRDAANTSCCPCAQPHLHNTCLVPVGPVLKPSARSSLDLLRRQHEFPQSAPLPLSLQRCDQWNVQESALIFRQPVLAPHDVWTSTKGPLFSWLHGTGRVCSARL